MEALPSVSSSDEFQRFVLQNEKVVVFFWAHWSEPCKVLDGVIAELRKSSGDLKWMKVEAEAVSDVSGHLRITAVPTFVFLTKGDEIDRLEGFDPAALYEKVSKHATSTVETLDDRLKTLVSAHPVMIFMKGSPDAPRCGFSRKVVDALRQIQVPFGSFDILTDEEVRVYHSLHTLRCQ